MSDSQRPILDEGSPDPLGDEMKAWEEIETDRALLSGLPVCARLDGRSFRRFCAGLQRPYDQRMSDAMVETTRGLVEHWQPAIGYTQSDEITLIWLGVQHFSGRIQKLASVLAGYASSVFVQQVLRLMPGTGRAELNPCFDCRVWQVPRREVAVEVLRWRQLDAIRNSVQMSAQSIYSPKELHGRGHARLLEMLAEKGVNWGADYPPHFQRGLFLQRVSAERTLGEEVRLGIPERHRPAPGKTFQRAQVEILDLPPIWTLNDAVNLLLPLPIEAP